MNHYLCLTGASGFLGRHLLKALAHHRPKVGFLVLARPNAAKKLRKLFDWLEPDRLQIIEGDIMQPELGLAPHDAARIRDLVSEVWHLAASTSFNEAEREHIEQANLGGTVRLLELARHIKHLENFYQISTAYVVGRNGSCSDEDTPPENPQFNNTYERKKWEVEKRVRQSGLPFTVFRPSIIIGESSGAAPGEKRMMDICRVCIALLHMNLCAED